MRAQAPALELKRHVAAMLAVSTVHSCAMNVKSGTSVQSPPAFHLSTTVQTPTGNSRPKRTWLLRLDFVQPASELVILTLQCFQLLRGALFSMCTASYVLLPVRWAAMSQDTI